jgi:hypothetical protein
VGPDEGPPTLFVRGPLIRAHLRTYVHARTAPACLHTRTGHLYPHARPLHLPALVRGLDSTCPLSPTRTQCRLPSRAPAACARSRSRLHAPALVRDRTRLLSFATARACSRSRTRLLSFAPAPAHARSRSRPHAPALVHDRTRSFARALPFVCARARSFVPAPIRSCLRLFTRARARSFVPARTLVHTCSSSLFVHAQHCWSLYYLSHT